VKIKYKERKFDLLYLVYQGLLNKKYLLIFFSNLRDLFLYLTYCRININYKKIEVKRYSFLNISSFLRNKFNLFIFN